MKDDKREEGLRYNEGKPMVDLIPPNVIIELAKHFTYGANKYHPHNWLDGFPYSQCYASLQRHLLAWYGGERNDPESGHHHLIAVIWNAVALMYFELLPAKYRKFDDRPWAQPPEIIIGIDAGEAQDQMNAMMRSMSQTQKSYVDIGIPDLKSHVLYKDGDTDIPNGMTDSNGQVVLSMCRVCGKAEVELDSPYCMGKASRKREDSVPIPEGMILLGPYAHIKENDLVWNPDKDGAQWTEASQLGKMSWTGQYGYDPIAPVVRRISRNFRYCPLCSKGAVDWRNDYKLTHESDCPFKEMKWKYILKSDDSIASWHRVFDRGAFRDPLPSELDCQVGGRAIVCDRTKDGKLCT